MTSAPILRLEDIRHRYGQRDVLRVPELAILPGEIFAVVGPSGAGKSTLLRLMNFLEKPTQGRVIYHDQAWTPGSLPIRLSGRRATNYRWLLPEKPFGVIVFGQSIANFRMGF